MRRSRKKILLSVLLTSIVLVGITTTIIASLMKSESGSRWLLEQTLSLVPVSIETKGITGTLAEEIYLESLSILLPDAEVHAKKVVLSWRPGSLLTGVVDLENVEMAELDIFILETDSPATEDNVASRKTPGEDATEDDLFWLDFPVHIEIKTGRIGRLGIDEVQFETINLSGSIGHKHLAIEFLEARIEGVDLHIAGNLSGPAPGRLEATASWEIPSENISGAGDFSGDIKNLGFTQLIKIPEEVNFSGTIHDLFTDPQLAGQADWVRIPFQGQSDTDKSASHQSTIYSDNGQLTVSSDFLSAHINLENNLLLEDEFFNGWSKMPLQLQAFVDLQAATINSYTLDVLDGTITGSGQIDFSDGLQGKLLINGTQINPDPIYADLIDGDYFRNNKLPGKLEFKANLQIESASSFTFNVDTAKATIADRNFSGQGRASWTNGELAAIKTNLNAGSNQLTADIKLGKQLAGSINAKAPDLKMLWPDLQGTLNAIITLSGSPEHPQAKLAAQANSVKLGTHSLETLNLSGKLQSNDRLSGKLVATGLVAGEQHLGNLDYTLTGSLSKHQSSLNLAGDLGDIELHANGSWRDGQLTQSFDAGRIQPEGLPSWQLTQKPELSLSSTGGKISAHCWVQQDASICMDASNWQSNNADATSLTSKIIIDNFALATLQPLLPDGYKIEGAVNADITISRETNKQRSKDSYGGLQGKLHWRQSRTLLTYNDGNDEFQTVFDEVKIDLLSNEMQTNFEAVLNGEQGLSMTATATVNGPLAAESPLQASAKGRLPDLALLRPLLQKVSNPGEVKGELTVDLSVAGTLGDPVFTGGANIADGKLQLLSVGITLSDINIAAQSEGTDKLLLTGQLRSGDGQARITGEVRSAEKQGFLAEIRIQGKNLASVRTPNLSLDSSPDLMLRITNEVFDISGKIIIPNATAQIRDLPKEATRRSEDVVVHTPDRKDKKQDETIVTGNIEVILGDEVWFNGFGLNSRLDGKLKLSQARGGFLRSNGTVRVRDGFLTGYGKELRVDRGELTFTGVLDDPLINIQVSRESIYEGRQYTIGLRLTGSAQHVKTEPFSRPAMSENDVLMFLVLDRPPNKNDDASGATLAFGLQQLVPLEGGNFGLDEVSFETNDANEAAMVAGKRINDKLYVRYVFGTAGDAGAFKIRYRLGRGFSLESSTGSQQSLDLIYLIER